MKTALETLAQAIENRRAQLTPEQRNDIFYRDPMITHLADKMFKILSNGTDHIAISQEWIEANAEK